MELKQRVQAHIDRRFFIVATLLENLNELMPKPGASLRTPGLGIHVPWGRLHLPRN